MHHSPRVGLSTERQADVAFEARGREVEAHRAAELLRQAALQQPRAEAAPLRPPHRRSAALAPGNLDEGTAPADRLKDQLRSTQPSETESAPYSAALVASSSKARLSVTTAFGRHHQPARPGTRAVLAQVPTLVLGAVLPLGPAHLEPRDDGAAILR